MGALPLSADAPKDQLLHQITVLILIDHDLLKSFRVLSCRRGRHIFAILPLYKGLQRQMLQISKIKDVFFRLLFGKAIHKILCQLHQHPDHITAFGKFLLKNL